MVAFLVTLSASLAVSPGVIVPLCAVSALFLFSYSGEALRLFPHEGNVCCGRVAGPACAGSPFPDILRHARPSADCGLPAPPSGVTVIESPCSCVTKFLILNNCQSIRFFVFLHKLDGVGPVDNRPSTD